MVMKKALMVLLILVLSSLVIAQSSEVGVDFNVGSVVDVGQDYIPSVSFWDTYGGYIIGLIIVLIIVIVFLKNRNPRTVGRRKVGKKIKRKK
jgi:hypothetical protein